MVINCKEIAEKIITETKEKITELKNSGIYPKLAVVMVGDGDASKIYVRNKTEACKKAGIETEEYIYNENISQEELIRSIENLNSDPSITGILVQLPLPKHIDETEICKTISPSKDVDVFNPQNFGGFILGDKSLIPCTAYGIIKILEYKKISLSGKNCVVIGRSNIVGKPTALLLTNRDATVTLCHSKTKDLKDFCKNADIIVSATGVPKLITKDMVKSGAVVIDVGINRDENGKICGDVDFKNVEPICSYITPVPGGVGPVTVAMLTNNTADLAYFTLLNDKNIKRKF
ncbi:MAG: bifunctional 5,10-methylenetetrahydrofolate dehydrogenase/5,10-methenyltetrahydrofolate cyclohydrolase [Clostridia bacterium]|nr:bifunctional 5,10-methylenetetrahydrofolate dehydrogenase/5,10-methenyltetrahydrofolate cyclohydrolase [Clostridia bacterium]